MWRTERGQRYSKLVNRRLDVRHILQRRLNESPTFIFHLFIESLFGGMSGALKLLISGIARTETNSKNAEPRYTAGTRDLGRDRLYFQLNEDHQRLCDFHWPSRFPANRNLGR